MDHDTVNPTNQLSPTENKNLNRSAYKQAHRPLSLHTVATLCFFFTLLLTTTVFASSIQFTDEEQAYLNSKDSLTMVCDPAWPPYDFIDAMGDHRGIAADYLKIFSSRIGVPIKHIPTETWTQSLEIISEDGCDLVSLLNKSAERSKHLDFTAPYVTSQMFIIGKGDQLHDLELDDLNGKTVAVVRGYWMQESLQKDYPALNLITAGTTAETLLMVDKGKAFATVGTLIESAHLIRHYALDNVKVIGTTPYTNKLRLGVRKGDEILLSIMQKAVESLSEKDKETVNNRWITIEPGPNYVYLMMLAGAVVMTGLALFIGFRRGRK